MAYRGSTFRVVAGALALICAMPAAAQFSDSYLFLKAAREADGTKATELLSKSGATVVNTRDPSTGETALHIVTKLHNANWVAFLLAKGAQPDLKDREGNTPLHLAALFGDSTAAGYLLGQRARVDIANNNGETPLILAVTHRNIPVVRQLLDAGANPNTADTIAGKSALDYARQDSRGAAVLKVLEDAKPVAKKPVSGPVL